jgi:flagellar basal-body rod protein FlgB
MMDRLFGAGSLRALETMLTFASDRQNVIAGNIANVDSVGYRTRDLSEGDFRSALARAFEGRGGAPEAFEAGEAADAGPLKAGGNNVDLEVEMAKMVRNSALHSTAAALLAHQFSLLREAVSGHVIS